MRPLYLVVEGPDGSGKSTLVGNLARLVRHCGELGDMPAWETREPGGNPLGERLRAILKDVSLQRHTPWLSRRLLFEADRVAQQELVRHHLRSGSHVVQDRCAAVSNHCYGAAEGADDGTVEAIEALDTDRLQPDLVLFVNTPHAEAALRMKGGPTAQDPAERDGDLLARVRLEYERLEAEVLDQRGDCGTFTTRSGFELWGAVLDGSLPPDALAREALDAVRSWASVNA